MIFYKKFKYNYNNFIYKGKTYKYKKFKNFIKFKPNITNSLFFLNKNGIIFQKNIKIISGINFLKKKNFFNNKYNQNNLNNLSIKKLYQNQKL